MKSFRHRRTTARAKPLEPPKLVQVTLPEPEPEPPAGSILDRDALTARAVDVTPAQAATWLEKNHPSNRPIAWRRVEAFSNDMRAGAWKLTHQGICFDGDGFLIDGQHRLQAVVQAQVTVTMMVVRNRLGTFHDPIDRGGPRTIATIMGLSTKDAASLNALRMLEVGAQIAAPMTLAEADALIVRHTAPWEEVRRNPSRNKLTGPMVAAVIWAIPVAREGSLEFMQRAATGEMISKGSPVYAFRSWRERNTRLHAWEVSLATLNCLRHFVTDSALASVYISAAGYRAFCAKRRAMKIPHTPGVDVVPTGAWTPSRSDRGDIFE